MTTQRRTPLVSVPKANHTMQELLRTNDLVLLSFLEGALRSQGIECVVLDTDMAALDGGVIAIPRRLMVGADDLARAKDVLEVLRRDYGPL